MDRLYWLLRRFVYPEDAISLGFFVAVSVLVFAQVIARYVFNSAFFWADEASRYLFIWLVFVGAAISVRKDEHIYMEVFLRFAPRPVTKGFYIAADLVKLGYFGLIVYYGYRGTEFMQRMSSTAMDLPMSYIYAATLVGGVLMVLRQAQLVLRRWAVFYNPVIDRLRSE